MVSSQNKMTRKEPRTWKRLNGKTPASLPAGKTLPVPPDKQTPLMRAAAAAAAMKNPKTLPRKLGMFVKISMQMDIFSPCVKPEECPDGCRSCAGARRNGSFFFIQPNESIVIMPTFLFRAWLGYTISPVLYSTVLTFYHAVFDKLDSIFNPGMEIPFPWDPTWGGDMKKEREIAWKIWHTDCLRIHALRVELLNENKVFPKIEDRQAHRLELIQTLERRVALGMAIIEAINLVKKDELSVESVRPMIPAIHGAWYAYHHTIKIVPWEDMCAADELNTKFIPSNVRMNKLWRNLNIQYRQKYYRESWRPRFMRCAFEIIQHPKFTKDCRTRHAGVMKQLISLDRKYRLDCRILRSRVRKQHSISTSVVLVGVEIMLLLLLVFIPLLIFNSF